MSKHVTVRFFAAARDAAGDSEISMESQSLRSLIDSLSAARPPLKTVLSRCSFLVDGLVAKPPYDIAIQEGVTVDVLPPFAGG